MGRMGSAEAKAYLASWLPLLSLAKFLVHDGIRNRKVYLAWLLERGLY